MIAEENIHTEKTSSVTNGLKLALSTKGQTLRSFRPIIEHGDMLRLSEE